MDERKGRYFQFNRGIEVCTACPGLPGCRPCFFPNKLCTALGGDRWRRRHDEVLSVIKSELTAACQDVPSLGRLAPPGPVKLPSRTPSGARALVSCQPPPAARPLIPSCPLSQELVPLHRRGFDECPKARGGSKRHWELSWRLLGQRAGHHDGRASASAPTAAADGRKVLSDGRGGPSVI